jgi:hypothetical protein
MSAHSGANTASSHAIAKAGQILSDILALDRRSRAEALQRARELGLLSLVSSDPAQHDLY